MRHRGAQGGQAVKHKRIVISLPSYSQFCEEQLQMLLLAADTVASLMARRLRGSLTFHLDGTGRLDVGNFEIRDRSTARLSEGAAISDGGEGR